MSVERGMMIGESGADGTSALLDEGTAGTGIREGGMLHHRELATIKDRCARGDSVDQECVRFG